MQMKKMSKTRSQPIHDDSWFLWLGVWRWRSWVALITRGKVQCSSQRSIIDSILNNFNFSSQSWNYVFFFIIAGLTRKSGSSENYFKFSNSILISRSFSGNSQSLIGSMSNFLARFKKSDCNKLSVIVVEISASLEHKSDLCIKINIYLLVRPLGNCLL